MRIVLYIVLKKINFFTASIISFIIAVSIHAYGADITSEKIATGFESFLKLKSWHTSVDKNSVNAFVFNPAHQALELTIEYNDRANNIFSVTINSKRNSLEQQRVFSFNKNDYSSVEQVNTILIPYLASLMDQNVEKVDAGKRSPFYSSARFGYYRTNDNKEIYPSLHTGMFFAAWKLAYDPARSSGSSTLYLGDYLDSFYSLSLDRKAKWYNIFDEFTFDIDLILYGKSNQKFGSRNLYGLFTTMSYYRPMVKRNRIMQWNHSIFSNRIHVQYCYWEIIAFIQNFTLINNEKSLSFRYRFGIGPGHNSSITMVGIKPEDAINPVFVSRWYYDEEIGDRKHNYYYNITVPVKLEFESDKYLNSKFELKYHFLFSQSITHDRGVRDFINRVVVNYGYYVTNDINVGFGYEFWHTWGVDNGPKKLPRDLRNTSDSNIIKDNRKNSHSWNRFIIQMEMKI